MAYKAMVFCAEVDFDKIKLSYDKGIQKKYFEVISYTIFENDKVNLIAEQVNMGGGV